MEGLDNLLRIVEYSRHGLQLVKDDCPEGGNASKIIENRNMLAKNLFAVARFHYSQRDFGNAIPFLMEAQGLVGASVESSYFLMHCYFELGRFDDAYLAFRESRNHSFGEHKHPLYIDPDTTLADILGLGKKVVDSCERLQRPVTEEDYQDWHWNKRFLDYRELRMIAEGYYPPGTEGTVVYHPFEFNPCERHYSFDGLVSRGIPFVIESPGSLEIGNIYPARIRHLLISPQSSMEKLDAASWFEVTLVSKTD
jgi:hypothetical protein